MLKSLCCDTPNRRVRLGWLSFQKNGDISFGLADSAYVAPRFNASIGIWNAYNRVRSYFEIVSDPTAAEKVHNPHLTFHSPIYFHFKSHTQSAKEASFRAIADIPIMLEQQDRVDWIRAVSAPISLLKTAGQLRGRFSSEELSIHVPSESLSISVKIDFVNSSTSNRQLHNSLWHFNWHGIGIQLSMSYTYPHFATMAWAHYH